MKRSKYFPVLFLSFALILLSSCEEQEGVSVVGISGIRLRGFHDGVLAMDVTLGIRNRMKHAVVVRGLKAKVFFGKTEAGTIAVSKKIRILAEEEKNYTVPVEVTIHKPGDLITSILEAAGNREKRELYLKGVLKIRSGVLCKRIPFDEKRKIHAGNLLF